MYMSYVTCLALITAQSKRRILVLHHMVKRFDEVTNLGNQVSHEFPLSGLQTEPSQSFNKAG